MSYMLYLLIIELFNESFSFFFKSKIDYIFYFIIGSLSLINPKIRGLIIFKQLSKINFKL